MWGRGLWSLVGLALAPAALAQGAAPAPHLFEIVSARYTDPTARYDHGVLGDALEWGALEFQVTLCPECRPLKTSRARIVLPQSRVFEDTAPRLADVDGDGRHEIVVVETDRDRGAQLAIYDMTGKIAETPFIGRPHRWLAPVGVADLDGDGRAEVAYVETPHLAARLRVWRWTGRGLTPVAEAAGLPNHRIGETDIAGGIRDCGTGPEIITANAGWSRLVATRLTGGRLVSRDIGPQAGRTSFAAALGCR